MDPHPNDPYLLALQELNMEEEPFEEDPEEDPEEEPEEDPEEDEEPEEMEEDVDIEVEDNDDAKSEITIDDTMPDLVVLSMEGYQELLADLAKFKSQTRAFEEFAAELEEETHHLRNENKRMKELYIETCSELGDEKVYVQQLEREIDRLKAEVAKKKLVVGPSSYKR